MKGLWLGVVAVPIVVVVAVIVLSTLGGASNTTVATVTETQTFTTTASQASETISSSIPTLTSTETSLTSFEHQDTQTVLFGSEPNPVSPLETIPADTLIWSNYTMPSTAYVTGAETSFNTISSSTSNANVTVAIYVNGVLLDSGQTTILPPVILPGQTTEPPVYGSEVTAFVGENITEGSVVTLAIFSQTPVQVPTNGNPTLTFQAQAASLPSTLPTSGSSVSYTIDLYGFK